MMGEMLAFTADQVSRLTGLSERQLRYWDKSGFFNPEYGAEDRRRPYSRLYSFQYVVGLRTISTLLNHYHVPTHELRRVGAWLREHHDTPWASLRLYVGGRRVYFDDPATGARIATKPRGQMAFPIEMEKVASSVRDDIDRVRARPLEKVGHVANNRNIVQNAPVVAGTRIPTEAIWNFHQAGYDADAIIREYPQITSVDVHAAIDYETQRSIDGQDNGLPVYAPAHR